MCNKWPFWVILKREFLLSYRRRAEWFNPLIFYIIVCALFPLALGGERDVLTQIGPGVIWIAALLAILLSMDRLFRSDYEDGSLEQLLLLPYHPLTIILPKLLAHWLIIGIPLLCLTPLLAIFYQLNINVFLSLFLGLLIGLPLLSLLGSIGLALTIALSRGGLLLGLLVLPLYIPVLIVGTLMTQSASFGLSYTGHLAFLGAFLCLAIVLVPWLVYNALKLAQE